MTHDLIDDATVERCAMAAYEAVMASAGPRRDPWKTAAEQQKRTLRTITRAVLTEALQPAPTHGPLDGQEPLIGET